MKGRRALRRRRRRVSDQGFTLLELMVVVMLVAILAMVAAPSMTTARNDRLAFDYARQATELFHNARARSAGRGAAHLVVFTNVPAISTRGAILMFEALDGTPTPSGPNPSATCRNVSQWAFAASWVPGSGYGTNAFSRFVTGLNIDTTQGGAVQVLEDIKMTAKLTILSNGSTSAPTTFVVCTTPNGTTYAGTGNGVSAAITAMAASTESFKDLLEVDVTRNKGGLPVGLTRRVLLPGAAAPRIKSE